MGSKYPFVKSHSFFSKYFLRIFLHSQFTYLFSPSFCSFLSRLFKFSLTVLKLLRLLFYFLHRKRILSDLYSIQAQPVKNVSTFDYIVRLRFVHFRNENRGEIKKSVFLFSKNRPLIPTNVRLSSET